MLLEALDAEELAANQLFRVRKDHGPSAECPKDCLFHASDEGEAASQSILPHRVGLEMSPFAHR